MGDSDFAVPATKSSGTDLDDLRGELDRIDERLLDTLRERIECCVRIAEFKRDNDVPMMQPHRINVVQERAARFARAHGIDDTFMRRFYELIIGETCRVEDLVIDARRTLR